MSQLVSPQNNVWVTSAEIPCWWHVTSKVWIVLLTGLAVREFGFNQSEVLHIISMEFLHSFLRCYFAGNLLVALENVSCFVRLLNSNFKISSHALKFQMWNLCCSNVTSMQQAQVDMYEFDISGKLECIFTARNLHLIVMPMHPNFLNFQLEFWEVKVFILCR